MIRIVADTNVIISALVFGGLPRQIIDLAALGLCEICYSSPLRHEVEQVLKKKFGWSREEIQNRLPVLFSWFVQVHPQVFVAAVKDDPDDDRILECALAAQARAIISGDRHLLQLGSFESIPILTPRQFLDSKVWIEEKK
ncbi:MAG: putative toxin-antitoxin system toxin component, PIN family [Acidobacteriia bacterium]|nr:putative toxin-antitoxin system toxin component, PIN family [Terriglobia bacterium]